MHGENRPTECYDMSVLCVYKEGPMTDNGPLGFSVLRMLWHTPQQPTTCVCSRAGEIPKFFENPPSKPSNG